MKPREKIAITVAPDLLEQVERLRRKSGDSRSAVFERALLSYLGVAERTAMERRHADGYRRVPETPTELRDALIVAEDVFLANPWNAAG